jgi:glutamine amidotransferase
MNELPLASQPVILRGPWPTPTAAVVDYCAGNLFSIAQACRHAGLSPRFVSSADELRDADAVILPGVGAFGEAMASLKRLDLIGPLVDFAASGRPFVGICLGMQLLMTASDEFGRHQGLNIVAGHVARLPPSPATCIPNVGWRKIEPLAGEATWRHEALRETPPGAYMYFVHSYCVRPADPGAALTETRFGLERFCSGVARGNVWGFQFHPEKSGPRGLEIYRQIARAVASSASTKNESSPLESQAA